MADRTTAELSAKVSHRVTVGRGVASSGAWFRLRSNPKCLLVSTVAHVLFGRDRALRTQVRVSGTPATLRFFTPLSSCSAFSADAALLQLPAEFASKTFLPSAGHLNRFVQNLDVLHMDRSGNQATGRLVIEKWSGLLAYSFGRRRLYGQWIVQLDNPSSSGIGPGDSGSAWFTRDATAVGIQVGILPRQRNCVIVTPFDTVASLFGALIAR